MHQQAVPFVTGVLCVGKIIDIQESKESRERHQGVMMESVDKVGLMCTPWGYWRKKKLLQGTRSRSRPLRNMLGGDRSVLVSKPTTPPPGQQSKSQGQIPALLSSVEPFRSWLGVFPVRLAESSSCWSLGSCPLFQHCSSFLLFTFTPTLTPWWPSYLISAFQEEGDDSMLASQKCLFLKGLMGSTFQPREPVLRLAFKHSSRRCVEGSYPCSPATSKSHSGSFLLLGWTGSQALDLFRRCWS